MRAASDAGAHIVFFSSSQVFDGETPLAAEDTSRVPKNVYGRQKLEVETAIADEKLPAAILRVTKVLVEPAGWDVPRLVSESRARQCRGCRDKYDAGAGVRAGRSRSRHCAWRRTAHRHLAFSSSDEIPYYDAALRRMAADCGLPQHLVRGEPVTEQQVPNIFRHRYTALNTAEGSESARGLDYRQLIRLRELFDECSATIARERT